MPVTIPQLSQWKKQGRKIAALTAYDYAIARILDEAGVDLILVGDSLGMVVLGYETTVPVTLEEMLHHAKAVKRAVKNALVVVDLPFLTYQVNPEQALLSAGRVLKETGAQAVKLEGVGSVASIKKLVSVGIPVLGHIGLTPQSIHQLGGYRQQGKTLEEAERLMQEALDIEAAGAFAIVLEHIPTDLATKISEKLTVPTIGIGAGHGCDGQVLVINDVLGLSDWQPPFAKVYVNLQASITKAVKNYCTDVRNQEFPTQ